jgi:hypothetical protein
MVRSFAVKTQERTVTVKVKEITLTIVRHNRNSGETSNCCVCMAFISSVKDTDPHLDPPGSVSCWEAGSRSVSGSTSKSRTGSELHPRQSE